MLSSLQVVWLPQNNYYIIDRLKRRISFLAPVYVYPGQDEMQALTENALSVLRGERLAQDY